MATLTNLVTFEDAKTRIEILPMMEPCPNATNIRAVMKAITGRLQTIPSYQSTRCGYMGMICQPKEYALT